MAKAHGMSLNAEILQRLQASIDANGLAATAKPILDELRGDAGGSQGEALTSPTVAPTGRRGRMKSTAVLALMLAGCGIMARVDARTRYQQSVADYRACVDANGNNLRACEGKRAIVEADEHAYNNLQAGAPSTSNVIIQGR
jgi:hypothetical protein